MSALHTGQPKSGGEIARSRHGRPLLLRASKGQLELHLQNHEARNAHIKRMSA